VKSWKRLITALGDDAARLKLRPPASQKTIAKAEKTLGMRLPEDYRSWLAIANGQEVGGLSILPNGNWLIPLERVIDEWSYQRGFDLDDYDGITETQDGDRIRWFVFHPKRIVIAGAEHLDYDNDLLDLIPGPAGTVGQLIVFVTECDFVVLAPSFGAYLDRVAELLEAGTLTPRLFNDGELMGLGTEDGRVWNYLARGEKPPRSRIKARKTKAKAAPKKNRKSQTRA
jgi:cell wall assembly regulator SMI1